MPFHVPLRRPGGGTPIVGAARGKSAGEEDWTAV